MPTDRTTRCSWPRLRGLEVGAEGAGDGDGGEPAHRERSGHEDHAVDLGCLAVAAAHPRFVHEHFDLPAYQFVTFATGDALLQVAQLSQPFVDQLPGHLAVE